MEPGFGNWRGTEDFVEVFWFVGCGVNDDAEGADAEVRERGSAAAGGEDCCWHLDFGWEGKGFWVQGAGRGEECDVEVDVRNFGR